MKTSKSRRRFSKPAPQLPGFLPVKAVFVHLKHAQFGEGWLTHVPRRGDTVLLGEELFTVKDVVWNLNHDPTTVEVIVDHFQKMPVV